MKILWNSNRLFRDVWFLIETRIRSYDIVGRRVFPRILRASTLIKGHHRYLIIVIIAMVIVMILIVETNVGHPRRRNTRRRCLRGEFCDFQGNRIFKDKCICQEADVCNRITPPHVIGLEGKTTTHALCNHYHGLISLTWAEDKNG